ncbi:hypothetical protein PCL_04758 [Purpureocillium lilacinum]|uniref:Uncharacterized protein n=1 Tax=Purpureocillium lilacinum TaxID=33203 RepID=A0A2U3DWI7_PURLI|nr:hypothetical protein PCL_04758 [Purpureocillium lilacinum]
MKPTTVLATFAALAGEALGSPSPAPSQSSRRAQQPVEFNIHDQGFTKIVCSRFPFTLNSERFENARSKNIEYFETAYKSKPVLEPGKCERVGCWDHIGTWWCNESKEQKNPDSWKDVVKALKAIPEVAKKKCLAWNYRDFGFQIFHESGWSVMIGYDSEDLLVAYVLRCNHVRNETKQTLADRDVLPSARARPQDARALTANDGINIVDLSLCPIHAGGGGGWRHRARRDSNQPVFQCFSTSTGRVWTLVGGVQTTNCVRAREETPPATTSPSVSYHLRRHVTGKGVKKDDRPHPCINKPYVVMKLATILAVAATLAGELTILLTTGALAAPTQIQVLGSPSSSPLLDHGAAPPPPSSSLLAVARDLTPRSGEYKLNEDGFTKITCGKFKATDKETFDKALERMLHYLRDTNKKRKQLAPGKCDRIACYENVGVWWCNEVTSPPFLSPIALHGAQAALVSKGNKAPDSWPSIYSTLKSMTWTAKPRCTSSEFDTLSFQIYHESGWSLTLSSKVGEYCKATHGKAWQGMARHGTARHGTARQGGTQFYRQECSVMYGVGESFTSAPTTPAMQDDLMAAWFGTQECAAAVAGGGDPMKARRQPPRAPQIPQPFFPYLELDFLPFTLSTLTTTITATAVAKHLPPSTTIVPSSWKSRLRRLPGWHSLPRTAYFAPLFDPGPLPSPPLRPRVFDPDVAVCSSRQACFCACVCPRVFELERPLLWILARWLEGLGFSLSRGGWWGAWCLYTGFLMSRFYASMLLLRARSSGLTFWRMLC